MRKDNLYCSKPIKIKETAIDLVNESYEYQQVFFETLEDLYDIKANIVIGCQKDGGESVAFRYSSGYAKSIVRCISNALSHRDVRLKDNARAKKDRDRPLTEEDLTQFRGG